MRHLSMRPEESMRHLSVRPEESVRQNLSMRPEQSGATAGPAATLRSQRGGPALSATGECFAWLRRVIRCEDVMPEAGDEPRRNSLEAELDTIPLNHDLIALYFSASFSAPCRLFTPILVEA